MEGDFASIREALSYQITDPTQFDPGTPSTFNFLGHSPDREQAVFAQDLIRGKNWTFNVGLRFDHYDLLVNQSAWSPRVGIAYYWRRPRSSFVRPTIACFRLRRSRICWSPVPRPWSA